MPEKSQGIRVKVPVDSILAAHTRLPDGALASEGRIALANDPVGVYTAAAQDAKKEILAQTSPTAGCATLAGLLPRAYGAR